MLYFVGIDWASEEHAVCVIDGDARVVWRGKVSHTAEGLADLRRSLERLAPAAELRVAIERPTGLLVDTLVDAGLDVVPLHPNAVKASPPALLRSAGEDRPRRCLHAGRHAAHRRPPLAAAERHCPTRPGRCARWSRRATTSWTSALPSPTSCAPCSRASGPAPQPSSPTSTRRSRSPSSHAIRRPTALPASARSASPPSWPSTPTAAVARPASCSPDSARRPQVSPATPKPRPRANSSARSSPCCTASSPQLAKLSAAIEHAVDAHSDGAVVMSFPRAGRVCAAQILAELGDDRARFLTADHLAAEAGARARHARIRQASAASSSAGPATSACARPSPASPTTPATAPPGPPASTAQPAAAAAAIPTPSASSRAPGCASSGALGRIEGPTTNASTVPPNPRRMPIRRPREEEEVDTGCLMPRPRPDVRGWACGSPAASTTSPAVGADGREAEQEGAVGAELVAGSSRAAAARPRPRWARAAAPDTRRSRRTPSGTRSRARAPSAVRAFPAARSGARAARGAAGCGAPRRAAAGAADRAPRRRDARRHRAVEAAGEDLDVIELDQQRRARAHPAEDRWIQNG